MLKDEFYLIKVNNINFINYESKFNNSNLYIFLIINDSINHNHNMQN